MNGYRRIALYNGMSWDIPNGVTPQSFLDEALVPNYPDLRGSQITETVNHAREEVTFEFSKAVGQKGL